MNKWIFRAAAVFAALLVSNTASADVSDVQTAWRLLDYMAVDYRGAVANGTVKSASEYAEMKEFAAGVSTRLRSLPSSSARDQLLTRAASLETVIGRKGSPEEVAGLAHGLAADLLKAYPVPLAPSKAPDAEVGNQLFAQNCSSCHGASGDGHGPNAAKLATPPIAFTDSRRAQQRSVFALYQVISQGIDGTAMQGFANLSDDQRWALAFHAGSLSFSKAQVSAGERLWTSDPGLRARIPDLKSLIALTPVDLAKSLGQPQADALLAFLRLHPDQVTQRGGGSLAVVREKLKESVAAVQRGDRATAKKMALSAYLDGFEPIEPTLSARDATLLGHIEGAMGEYRAAVERGATAEDLTQRTLVIGALLDDAESALSPDASSQTSTFVGALTILLREGLEALLIVVAMIAFLRKADRPEALRYVHGGWVGALVAGGVTWAVATYAIGVSGASRELTEGFGSLFAAAVLLSVGIWMHGKSQADQWQRYIREKMANALSGGSGWFLFALAFVVVYREVFETILFYAALSSQGNNSMLVAGAGTAIALLAVIAWAMLRYSQTLPIAQFFRYSSWLMAVLTVILVGKGIAALQEAGIIDIAPFAGAPRISVLGVFPTWESISVQLTVAAVILIAFVINGRKPRLVRHGSV